MGRINELVAKAHENAVTKGWWEEDRKFGEIAALIHSEVSEALDHYRNGRGMTEVFYLPEKPNKPDGIPIELADVVIRVFDICGKEGIDLEEAIKAKMEYNAGRSYRHGGKVI